MTDPFIDFGGSPERESFRNALSCSGPLRCRFPLRVEGGEITLDADASTNYFTLVNICKGCDYSDTVAVDGSDQCGVSFVDVVATGLPDSCYEVSFDIEIITVSGSPAVGYETSSQSGTLAAGFHSITARVEGDGTATVRVQTTTGTGGDCWRLGPTATVNGLRSKCTEPACTDCVPSAIAVPVFYEKGGFANAICSKEVEIFFPFMADWEIACLPRFDCADECIACFCENESFADCGDACSVFTAFWNPRTSRWESTMKAADTFVAIVGEVITEADRVVGVRQIVGEGGATYNQQYETGGVIPGCGTVFPAKDVLPKDLVCTQQDMSDCCCDGTPIQFFQQTYTGGLESGAPGAVKPNALRCIQTTFTPPSDFCDAFCIRQKVEILNTIAPEIEIVGLCHTMKQTSGGPEIAGTQVDEVELCFFGKDTVTIETCVGADPQLGGAETQYQVTLIATPLKTQCELDVCADITQVPNAPELQVFNLNTGVYKRGEVVLVTRTGGCKYYVTSIPKRYSDGCELDALGFCGTATVKIGGVTEMGLDPDGFEWDISSRTSCECLQCYRWNKKFLLETHRWIGNGGAGCGFALLNHCYSGESGWVTDGYSYCGPFFEFPCSAPGDQTGIYFTASTVARPTKLCGFLEYDLVIGSFDIYVKGCKVAAYQFEQTPIPERGTLCIQAKGVTIDDNSNGSGGTHERCARDMNSGISIGTCAHRLPTLGLDEGTDTCSLNLATTPPATTFRACGVPEVIDDVSLVISPQVGFNCSIGSLAYVTIDNGIDPPYEVTVVVVWVQNNEYMVNNIDSNDNGWVDDRLDITHIRCDGDPIDYIVNSTRLPATEQICAWHDINNCRWECDLPTICFQRCY